MPSFRRCGLLAVLVAVSACQTSSASNRIFPTVIGASAINSDITPCADYASHTGYTGQPYRVYVPETGKLITRHQGIDFCGNAGDPVISSVSGKIVLINPDNQYRGGTVIVESDILAKRPQYPTLPARQVYFQHLHIDPAPSLKYGQHILAGDLLGWMQAPGKRNIGPRSHVHLEAGFCQQTYSCHTDPNQFWMNGAGSVTCFDPENQPPADKAVAPVPC